MAASSELALDLGQQVGVRGGVHLALQDLRRAGDRQRTDLVAQRFLRARDLLLDLGLGGGEDAVRLGPSPRLSPARPFPTSASRPAR